MTKKGNDDLRKGLEKAIEKPSNWGIKIWDIVITRKYIFGIPMQIKEQPSQIYDISSHKWVDNFLVF